MSIFVPFSSLLELAIIRQDSGDYYNFLENIHQDENIFYLYTYLTEEKLNVLFDEFEEIQMDIQNLEIVIDEESGNMYIVVINLDDDKIDVKEQLKDFKKLYLNFFTYKNETK